MSPVKFVRRYPLVVVVAVGVASAAWMVSDVFRPYPGPAFYDPRMPTNQAPSGEPLDVPPPTLALKPRPGSPEAEKRSLVVRADLLPKLKPGMTRAEVEGLVGAPAPEDVQPAVVAGERVTYQTSYEFDLGPAATIRPIDTPRLPRERPATLHAARGRVTLEFDATKPGHPLVEIRCTEPLS